LVRIAISVTLRLDAVLTRKKRETPPIEPIFDGERQAQLIALACSEPPTGGARWTIRLLAEQVVERKIVESAHFNTVARALKKRHQAALEGILVIPPSVERGRAARRPTAEIAAVALTHARTSILFPV
jgi:hypothetical protein